MNNSRPIFVFVVIRVHPCLYQIELLLSYTLGHFNESLLRTGTVACPCDELNWESAPFRLLLATL